MGTAIVGGMLTSTVLTLVVIPVVYSLLDDAAAWGRRLLFGAKGPSVVRAAQRDVAEEMSPEPEPAVSGTQSAAMSGQEGSGAGGRREAGGGGARSCPPLTGGVGQGFAQLDVVAARSRSMDALHTSAPRSKICVV